jgi:signal peptidase I
MSKITIMNEKKDIDVDRYFGVTANKSNSANTGSRPKKPLFDGQLKSALLTIGLLFSAPLIALFLTATVFQPYEVFGPSMQKTLFEHDRLIVYKLPVTISKIFNKTYIPEHGKIVIFQDKRLADNKQLIKRVIGIPGDRVQIVDGQITVFNKENPDGYDPVEKYNIDPENIGTKTNNDILLGEGQLFVCGDNRANSLDSRTFGAFPASDIIGTAEMRIYPVGRLTLF